MPCSLRLQDIITEVCPLSWQVDVVTANTWQVAQTLSAPLQSGVRFLCYLIPALHSASIAVSLPAILTWQEKYRLTVFRIDN